MRGPSSGEVEDSYLHEQMHGRPIGFDLSAAEAEYRARHRNTDYCGNCGQQVLWVRHEGRLQAVSSVTDGDLEVLYEDGRLRAVPGATHGIHRCQR